MNEPRNDALGISLVDLHSAMVKQDLAKIHSLLDHARRWIDGGGRVLIDQTDTRGALRTLASLAEFDQWKREVVTETEQLRGGGPPGA